MPRRRPGRLQAMLTADLPDPGLARVAEESGGGYTEIRYGEDLGAAFARRRRAALGVIGFAPPKRDGKTHDIEVRVKQKDAKPRAAKADRAEELLRSARFADALAHRSDVLDGTNLDAADLRPRELRGDANGLLHVWRVDEVEAAKDLFRFREGPSTTV